jgi:hypothetical protein
MKVVSGSLDVLETVGKKTFDVCILESLLFSSNIIVPFTGYQ